MTCDLLCDVTAQWIINFQKGGTLPYVLFLMWYFEHYSVPAYFYAAAHGSYGLIWLIKHFVTPDDKVRHAHSPSSVSSALTRPSIALVTRPASHSLHVASARGQWNIKTTVGSQLISFVLVLGPYWVAPYLLISGATPLPSVGRCCAAMIVYAIGVVMMCVADCYKAVTLEHKRGLITTGPFAYVRHPNYLGAHPCSRREIRSACCRAVPTVKLTPLELRECLPNMAGEMMIYGAFATMVPHWIPWAVLAWVWGQARARAHFERRCR